MSDPVHIIFLVSLKSKLKLKSILLSLSISGTTVSPLITAQSKILWQSLNI
jgi:hypothetical protein